MLAADIFIFIIASFEEPVYNEFINMRKLQLDKYKIPHMFLFDGEPPAGFTCGQNDRFFKKMEGKSNPHMYLKFIEALRDPLFKPDNYKYILRINLSTFINFPLLFTYLDKLPTSRCCASHSYDLHIPNISKSIKMISGAAMIFTPDCIEWLRQRSQITDDIIYKYNDDVVISLYMSEFKPMIIKLQFNYNHTRSDRLITRLKTLYKREEDVETWRRFLRDVDDL